MWRSVRCTMPRGAIVLFGMLAAPRTEAQSNAAPQNASSIAHPEIVVEGRRKSERYRIPPELRTIPREIERRTQAADPRLACRMVGPRGCGTPVMPIFTVTGDGKVRIGAAREP